MNREESLAQLHVDLGLHKLRRTWAKVEIVLGLTASGAGLLLGNRGALQSPEPDWLLASTGLVLFILGGYLALAGHRSHLYQSSNELAAYLAERIRSTKPSA